MTAMSTDAQACLAVAGQAPPATVSRPFWAATRPFWAAPRPSRPTASRPATPTASRPTTSRTKTSWGRWLAALAAVLVIMGGYATWTNLRPYTLQASIVINASPRQVWAILTDLSAYPRWNPFIISAHGRLRVGCTLTNQMRDSAGTTTFTPVVLAVRPDRELRWMGKVGPGGIFDGEHAFLIQPLGRGRIRFTQREQFTGVAIPFYEHRLQADTLPQFRAMNAALARRASRTGAAG